MNKNYKKINKSTTNYAEELLKVLPWEAKEVPAEIPHGDMPGDKIEIDDSHVQKANTIFSVLAKEIAEKIKTNPYQRTVISVCGGSGVGKSEIASVLGWFLNQAGIGTYILSGDNYPHRIPMYNDAERLHIFRESAVRGMVDAGDYTDERFAEIRKWQQEDTDADKAHAEGKEWFMSYLAGGREGLSGYLGTPNETDFDEVSTIISAFKDGAADLWLRRMGRDASSLWYDEVDFSDKQVLIIEWTHGNSDFLKGVDIPVLLNSTPAETLAHRRARNRDGKTDSAFTTMVLEIEQAKLHSQAHKAKIICAKNGELISFDEYTERMKDQF
ncbi:adenylylsulfate kinase [Oribacterium sp. WCC10]|uniref:adenylylsulfate kinase n=1 Tax=Oribacterium sp. WCC10 TaxID=1855343 RepID=UPI0008E27552|nr:adenylylsulfate kinase [Oribacterium sp. WCC10]SFG14328.1 alpha-galactosidase [Oribacterium sp. WCC10]